MQVTLWSGVRSRRILNSSKLYWDFFSDAQGQLTPQSVVGSGRISNSSELSLHVIITSKYEKDRIKIAEKKGQHRFFHYNPICCHGNQSSDLAKFHTHPSSHVYCCDYIKKYSRPIGFLYFYRPINIILSADWSDYIKDINLLTRRLPKSGPKLYNRPIVGRRSADTSADDTWRATIGRSSAVDRPTVGRHIGR